MQLKVTTVGSSAGIVLPKEILARLNVEKGDNLYVIPTATGIELTAYDPEFALQIDTAKEIMRKNKDVLKKLAE